MVSIYFLPSRGRHTGLTCDWSSDVCSSDLVTGFETLYPRGSHVLAGPLTAAGGPYRVQVGDNATNATGTYEVRLERVTAGAGCEGTSLTCDVAVSDSLQNHEESDLFSFSAG